MSRKRELVEAGFPPSIADEILGAGKEKLDFLEVNEAGRNDPRIEEDRAQMWWGYEVPNRFKLLLEATHV